MISKKEWLEKALETIDNMTKEEFVDSLQKAGFFKENSIELISHPLPPYGDLLTRAEYENQGRYYDSCFPSDGKVYWHTDPEWDNSPYVLCLSK